IYRFAKTISLPPLLEPWLVVEIDGFAFSPVGDHDVDLREVSALLRNLQSQCPAGMPQRIGHDLELDRVEQILPGDRLTGLVAELHRGRPLSWRTCPLLRSGRGGRGRAEWSSFGLTRCGRVHDAVQLTCRLRRRDATAPRASQCRRARSVKLSAIRPAPQPY